MERVGWHPVGMYEKRRTKSTTFCYTLITIALMAGTAALVVSWLLATGVIDPDRRQNFKEPRRLDVFRDLNRLEADIKKVTFPTRPPVNVTKPFTATEVAEKMELEPETNTETGIEVIKETENKVEKGYTEEVETTTEIQNLEKTILEKIDTEVLLQPETDIGSSEEATNTETIKINITTIRSVEAKEDPETTINQEVTEISATTVINKTQEEEENENEESTEPFTVPNISTIEAIKEDTDASTTITSVTLADILTETVVMIEDDTNSEASQNKNVTMGTKEESTEPFTVPSLTTIEATKEDTDATTIPSVTLGDILTGKLETTTVIDKSEAETTTAEKTENESN